LSTAQLDRQAPVGPDVPPPTPGPVRRIGQLRQTSPGRLQLILAALLTLGLLTGLVAGLAANAAAAGTDDLGDRAQPLLVEAETIYSALADADTTAAQAFLAGGLEPPELTRRYEADLDRATTALTSAARRTPDGSDSADAVRTLSSGVSRYAALVASARANNRQGLPVGASYLSAASTLNRETLQPQAQALFRTAQTEVDDGYSGARSMVWVALLTLLLIGLLVALVATQRYLSRTTRRTFNIPLVAATAVTVVLALGAGGVLLAQRAHLRAAEADGSTPVALLAEARILALRERGDEALTLAARGSGGAYEDDFRTVSARLGGANGLLAAAGKAVDGDARAAVRSATAKHAAYVAAHKKVRELDDGGNYDGAVDLAIGPQTSATFTGLTDDIGRALESRKTAFTDEIGRAGRGLGLLTVLGPLLALIICALAVSGVRARLEEYR
jgi:hypothetical protein